jgi:hypothetical protein
VVSRGKAASKGTLVEGACLYAFCCQQSKRINNDLVLSLAKKMPVHISCTQTARACLAGVKEHGVLVAALNVFFETGKLTDERGKFD